MIIALDIEDTITRRPEFFATITKALRNDGHRIIIITFRLDRAATTDDLERWAIHYDELVTCSLDEHLEHDLEAWKGRVCRERGVDIFFEDNPAVLRHVDPSVACFMPVDPRAIPKTTPRTEWGDRAAG